MAPIYLLDIYKILDTQLAELKASGSPVDPEKGWFLKGRLDALTEVRDFLKTGYEAKLPRRLRQSKGSYKNNLA